MITVSGTRLPLSIYYFAANPSSLLFLISALNKFPGLIYVKPYLSIKRLAYVPLPEPGGPNKITCLDSRIAFLFFGTFEK